MRTAAKHYRTYQRCHAQGSASLNQQLLFNQGLTASPPSPACIAFIYTIAIQGFCKSYIYETIIYVHFKPNAQIMPNKILCTQNAYYWSRNIQNWFSGNIWVAITECYVCRVMKLHIYWLLCPRQSLRLKHWNACSIYRYQLSSRSMLLYTVPQKLAATTQTYIKTVLSQCI